MTEHDATPDIAAAAQELSNTITEKLGDLADEIMDRPANWAGSDAWVAYTDARKNGEPWALEITRDWHLTKIAIATEARIDPTGDVINAKQYGASWQAIADQCGTTRQAAYDRWAKYSSV